MMLDYLNRMILTQPAPEIQEAAIARAMNTKVNGTQLRDVENINRLLTTTNPSLEFITEFQVHTLAEIRKELESGLPVAVWVVTSDSSNDFIHSVVIIGINDEGSTISYNDPTYGEEKVISQSDFMDIWEKPGARMIKIRIGRISRETLEKYMPQEETL